MTASDPQTEDLKNTPRRKPTMPDGSATRVPPQALDVEKSILACVLLSSNESMGECLEKLKGGAEVFYDLRNQLIYAEMAMMYDAREPIDFITLTQRLTDKKLLEQIGGIPYLNSLDDIAPIPANLGWYIETIISKWLLRRLIHTCTDVVSRVYDFEGENVDGLMDEVERDVLRISESRVAGKVNTIKELVKGAINTIEDYHQRGGALTGLSTGFMDLDKLTTGLHPAEMIVIAARPSVGKTSLAMNIAEAVAIDQRMPVGVFSLEMSASSLVLRMLCSRSRVNMRNIREGFLAERDFPKLTGAAGKLANAPLFIDDSSGLSILQLRAKARRMWQQFGIKLFVIDYLQLLHSESRKAENRQQEIADISSGIKALAKELEVPIIVLSQLNREVEREKGRAPRMSDLRESGAIEQDADLIGLLYRPNQGEQEEESTEPSEAIPVNLLIAKQRNGPANEDVHLTFLKTYTRFESASKIPDDAVPQN